MKLGDLDWDTSISLSTATNNFKGPDSSQKQLFSDLILSHPENIKIRFVKIFLFLFEHLKILNFVTVIPFKTEN